jgi:anti-sigma regulatory factor (Ser/Thr protein kinase)
MDVGDELHLNLPAEAVSVALVRNTVAERARAFGLDRSEIDGLKTAVSEACSNVVLHAYAEGVVERPLEVEMRREDGMIHVVVRDQGDGIRPPHGDRPVGLRMGLLLVGEIASAIELRSERGRGTELAFDVPLPARA